MNSLRILGRVGLLAAATWIAAAVSSGSALAATCSYTQTSQLFAPWGDYGSYTPFQGSTFESGASGWSWGNGANIVTGDSNPLLGHAGTHSVQIPGDGTARSPWVCVNATTPSMRFFVRRVSGTGNLTVRGVVNSGGKQVATLTTLTTVAGGWNPSPIVIFPPLLTASTTGINAQFQFTADPGTTFRIDDVELDPYLRR